MATRSTSTARIQMIVTATMTGLTIMPRYSSMGHSRLTVTAMMVGQAMD